jgi:beta-lactamase regulating signal transducer with metallopeptidase domain
MSAFAQDFLWSPVQVTVLAAAALGIDAMIGRRRPAARALVAISALVAVVGLSATALCPFPAWGINWDSVFGHPRQTSDPTAAGAPDATSALARRGNSHEVRGTHSSPNRVVVGGEPVRWSLASFWAKVTDNWALLAALLYLVGAVCMAVRIALGLAAVRAYRRNSRPIDDRQLTDLAHRLSAELGCHRRIDLREHSGLRTAATIGWRQPVILLPSDWTNWSDVERRAAIAHEIEHVRRHDFLSWIIAQIGVGLHFYHPLVHLLAARLRLQQELAADTAAVRALGGHRPYLETLAAMALRQSDARVAWPARPLLPSSQTFVRRLEMLRRSQSLHGDVSRPFIAVSIAGVAVVSLFAAGFRSSAVADDPASVAGNDLAIETQEEPAAPPTKEMRAKRFESVNRARQLALAMVNYSAERGQGLLWADQSVLPAAVIGPDGKTPHSWRVELLPYLGQQALYDQYRLNESWDSAANKRVLEQMPDVFRSPFDDPKSTSSAFYALVGPGTLFEGSKGIKWREVPDGVDSTILFIEAKREIPWTKPEDIPFDPDKPLAVGGFEKGHFSAGFADAHANSFNAEKVKHQLKWLILRNDGHRIEWSGVGD